VESVKVNWGFVLFNILIMRYILDCVNERGLHLEFETDMDVLSIKIKDDEDSMIIFLDKEGLFELIGALHHIQKQLSK
jgi:hypothetical protein